MSIVAIYLSPENSLWGRDSINFFSHLISLIYSCSESDFTIVCGDFNARLGDLDDFIPDVDDLCSRLSIDSVKNKHGEALIEFLKEVKMCIVNGRVGLANNDDYTCISVRGRSVVDYFLVPHINLSHCSNFKVLTVSDLLEKYSLQGLISDRCKPPDHSILSLTVTYSQSIVQEREELKSDLNLPTHHKRYKFDTIPINAMNNQKWNDSLLKLINEREMFLENQTLVDTQYEQFCKILLDEMDEFFSCGNTKVSKKKLKFNKPYWNETLSNLWRDMHLSEKNYLNACKKRLRYTNEFRNTFIHKRDLFDKALRKYERQYKRAKIENIDNINSTNPREFWKQIKQLGPKNKVDIPLKVRTENGFTSNEKEVLEKWKKDFEHLYNAPENPDFNNDFLDRIRNEKENIENNLTETNDYINRAISFDEVETVINKLKLNKATGIDEIPNEILKNHSIKLALWNLFNKYFDTNMIPSIWLKSVINPIPKSSKKDPYIPLNYRAISLQSCVYKAYSALLNNRITDYCDILDLIVDEQNGFRKNRSCEDHIYSLISILENKISNKESVFASFIDLEKAFDWIHRDLLLYRLLQYNIDGKIYKSIKSLYEHNESCIRLNNLHSDWFDVNSGVKQGDNISPTLFSLYLNDLAKEIKDLNLGIQVDDVNVGILLYADDMVLVANNEKDLQIMLNTMYNWCAKWRLKVNLDKSNIVQFRPKRKPQSKFCFKYGSKTLDYVSHYRYLGAVLDEHLSFNQCSKTLADAGHRALGAVISKFKQYKEIGYKTYSKLYNACVVPVTDYASAVWGYSKNSHSEQVQNKAIRCFLGVNQFTPIPGLQGEMGWMPAKFRKMKNMLRYWNRLVKMPNDRLTKKIFMHNQTVNSKWCQEIQEIFAKIDKNEIYDNTSLYNLDEFDNDIKPCIDNFWNVQINSKPKLRTFKTFKTNFEVSDYIQAIKNRYTRSIFAKFRLGILQLSIETGRYTQVKLEDRVCKLCNNGSIEDEFHFLCKCSKYNELRISLYENITFSNDGFAGLDDQSKFIFMLKSYNKYVVDYLKSAWELRKTILFRC